MKTMAMLVSVAYLRYLGAGAYFVLPQESPPSPSSPSCEPRVHMADQEKSISHTDDAHISGKFLPNSIAMPPDLVSRKKFHVLALHGHAQTASKFKGKIAAVTKEVKQIADFEFLDGPFIVPECHHSLENDIGKVFTWYDTNKYAEIEQSFAKISALNCDGIIGFSLGAAVLYTLLCHPDYGVHMRDKLKFVVFFSGFLLPNLLFDSWVDAVGTLDIQSFHCFGSSDCVIASDRSEALAEKFQEAVVYKHDKGHLVPASVRKELKVFLQNIRT